jgi:hypothetical protein
VRFKWLTFDEGYGGKPPLLRELDALGQNYVAEVPQSFRVWTTRPDVLYREHDRDRHRNGRPRKLPRLRPRERTSRATSLSRFLIETRMNDEAY